MRRIIWPIVGLLLVACCWYLFFKPYEYAVNFKANTTQGDIIETIRIWNRTLDSCTIVNVDSLNSLTQEVSRGGRQYRFRWNLSKINDTLTKVNIQITEPKNTITNKLFVAFKDLPIETIANTLTKEFYDILKEHLKITNVEIVGKVELESVYCACRTIETDQVSKAQGMMANYAFLADFTGTQNLVADGPPLVRLLEWSHIKGKLKYDFCFPVVKNDSLISNHYITFKEIKKIKALKAIYNGNYITSDRAWYALLNYAESNDLQVAGLPVEYFFNNPNLGARAEEWKAEIYLPIL